MGAAGGDVGTLDYRGRPQPPTVEGQMARSGHPPPSTPDGVANHVSASVKRGEMEERQDRHWGSETRFDKMMTGGSSCIP